MKILVLSDSHASLYFMRKCVEQLRPDAIVHLGDYFSDGQTLREENPTLDFYAVPGNCDRYRLGIPEAQTKLEIIGGAKIMLTHGHLHHVKMTLAPLMADARAMGAQAVLFGHTHEAYCHREEDGLWVLNPGSCGYGGGSAGILNVQDGKILSCEIYRG